jgi:putative nucleotidyltransferase with HDIG domain
MTYENDNENPLRILSLEDSHMDSILINEYLYDNFGSEIRIKIVATEYDFISAISIDAFDLILADFKLPGFDGFTALEHVKSICPSIPFLCVSGYIGEETVVELLKQGATDYISKDNLVRLKHSMERAQKEAQDQRDLRETNLSIAKQKEFLEISNKKLVEMLKQTINAISKIGELRDVYTAGHQKKVAELSIEIAREIGLSDEEILNISYGAQIHDIGKIYIPTDILNKPGKISNLEYQILQTHAEQGYEVVKEIDFAPRIPIMIYQHHERLDGSGYPQGLAGDQIIIESRILGVADVVVSMNEHRPYRAALGINAALEEISLHRGTKFDSNVVDACITLFREKGFEFTIV